MPEQKYNKNIASIFDSYIPQKRNLSFLKLKELIDYCYKCKINCKELEEIYENHYFYDSIEKIEQSHSEVYDFSVPDGHAFVGNGFINHNSTYLRQVALITLLTQIGCFIPATSAEIGIVDRIFTRIGAYDVIAEQKSTFMVEMTETAEILHNATQKSLILLDEVGRGTSTFDGLSIAWAVTEYLHALGPRTLFATHYHQLTELEQVLSNLKNYHVEVLEQKGEMIFIRKIRSGGTNRSYGIQVAALAGLPQKVINRAIEVLAELEEREILVQGKELDLARVASKRKQTSLFDWVAAKNHPVIDELLRLDIQNLTPLEALNKLHELKTKVKDIEAKSR
ncbi:MAG: hypothetical protein ACFFDI_11570 [Promethearchaeota archaeon]